MLIINFFAYARYWLFKICFRKPLIFSPYLHRIRCNFHLSKYLREHVCFYHVIWILKDTLKLSFNRCVYFYIIHWHYKDSKILKKMSLQVKSLYWRYINVVKVKYNWIRRYFGFKNFDLESKLRPTLADVAKLKLSSLHSSTVT